jgi:O-antigen ligase
MFSKTLLNSHLRFSQSIGQRIELAHTAGKLLANNFIFGRGLNSFVIDSVKTGDHYSTTWLLQPVHNIYLLTASETGIIGGLILYLFLSIILTKVALVNRWYFLAIIFILVTGLFDHYWFTLQQNMLLLGLLIGASCHSAIKSPRGKLVS